MKPELILIVAASADNIIGVDNDIPWRMDKAGRARYKADMVRFADLTSGHPVFMGRLTYESIPKKFRPLPGRHNFVLSRTQRDYGEGVTVVSSVESALHRALTERSEQEWIDYSKAWICGGSAIYRAFWPHADKIELTRINTFVGRIGDDRKYFPLISPKEWDEVYRDDDNKDFSFITYERVRDER
jgi:dihydrofolate reductase